MAHTINVTPVALGRLFFGFLVAMPLLAKAQATEDLVVRPSQPRLEVMQGNVLAIGFVVMNRGQRRQSLSARLFLPEGWRPVLRETGFSLDRGEEETRLVSFSMPPAAAAGTYEIRYRVFQSQDDSKYAEGELEVVIVPVRQVTARLVEVPRFVIAGDEYAAVFSIVNSGNVPGKVRINTRNSDGYRVQLDSSVVFLGPRSTREITAIVTTSSSIREKTVNTVEVHATFLADSTATARASGIVDIIPQVTDVADEHLLFPLRMKATMAGEDDRLGSQVEISGIGTFSRDNSDLLEIFLRSPDIQSQSPLALRDEYRVRYRSKFGEVKIGDWNYSLSPLTELGRYAFGGGGFVDAGRARAGGFYNHSRFFTPDQKQIGGFLKYEVTDGYEIGVHHLQKEEQVKSNVSSVRGELRPIDAALLDLEYAVSKAGALHDEAVAARLSARDSWGNLDIRLVSAGPDFQGYYKDVNHGSVSVNVSPFKDTHAEAYFRSERRNKANDTALFYVPYEQHLQVGGGFSNLLALYYNYSSQEDLLPIPQYKRAERAVQLRIGYTLFNVNLFSNIDLGSAKDQLLGKAFPFQRYAVYAGVSPVPTQNYSLSWETSSGNDLFTGEQQERVSFSVAASLFLSNMTNILGSVYWSRTNGTSRQEFGLVDVTMQHEFPNHHQIAVRARQNYSVPSLGSRELAFQLSYSVPLAIPVQRLNTNGKLTGRVVDEHNSGIANVLVNVGKAAAVTDDDGKFTFPSLSPGRHYLIVDKPSIGLDRVTQQPMPMEISIREGRESRLVINTARGGSIGGIVSFSTFMDSDSGETVGEQGGRAGVLVEATSGSELQRRLTDSRGRFFFAELKPGQWTVKVVGGEIPMYHYLENDNQDVEVAGGFRKEANFRIIPRKRAIKIIQVEESPVVLSPPDPPSGAATDCVISYDPKRRGYILQVSSWATRSKASERALVAAHVSGKKATIERAIVPGVGVRYRVKVALFNSLTEAEINCRILYKLEMEPAHN